MHVAFKIIVSLFVCTDLQELLIGLKQVLNTEYRRGLFPLIDTLLDER
jgi:hypothetical protein